MYSAKKKLVSAQNLAHLQWFFNTKFISSCLLVAAGDPSSLFGKM